MLLLSYIRTSPDEVIRRLAVKNFDAAEIVKGIIAADEERRNTQKLLDDGLAEANLAAKEIGKLFQEGKAGDAAKLKERTAELKIQSKELDERLKAAEEKMNGLLVLLPNTPHESVPAGKSAEDNEIVASWGDIPAADENIVPHWELTTKYNIIDFETGVKLTGAGFPVYRDKGAKLQRSLINFFLDNAVAAGYMEIQPPLMVNEASAYATGQLPDKDGQMYYIGIDKFYMIPTAEVPVTNIYRDMILKEKDMPIKNAAYSSCFRREAGSYGKDVRGLNRLHQFDKVEIVQIAHPDNSYSVLEEMKEHVAGLLRKLELPFRIVKLCGGDMSFTSALTFDFEVFAAGQQKWLEVSSVSNFENFQSNRMKLRYKNADGKINLTHTLNGSALALPRIVAALLENNQTPDGIKIPAALASYTGFDLLK
ncbi:MAG: serine--tRNA ligase [Bacteroidota bacterium]